MCSGRSRTARETQNIPLAVPEQSIAPLKEMLKRSLPASSHLADREVFPFLFSLPKKPIPERKENPVPVFYVDGHRKPVYADALIPRGLIGRTGKILGCRALVVLHDREGHP